MPSLADAAALVHSASLGHAVTQTAAEAEECGQWIAGKRGTYVDRLTRSAAPGGFTSQFRQDRTLYHLLFRNQTGGVYLDVAANHYKRIINTYFYDRCLGWKGICVEPNPVYHDELQRKRSCELIPFCASNSTDEVELRLPTDGWIGALGGIAGGRLREYARQIGNRGKSAVTKRMRCVRLGDELMRLAVARVDLFSLDVEGMRGAPDPGLHPIAASHATRASQPGHEAAVLRGIDFCKVIISQIVCEDHCAGVLPSWGYTRSRPVGFQATEQLWTRPRGVLNACRTRPPRGARHRDTYSKTDRISRVCGVKQQLWLASTIWNFPGQKRHDVHMRSHLQRLRRSSRS